MSRLLPNQTTLSPDVFFFLVANGQTINISTVNTNSISTNTIVANDIQTNHIETSTLTAETVSSAIGVLNAVSTTYLDLDGQVLTATPTQLLLNGVPLATTSNLSSIADWSLDPAISSINANGYDLLNANLVSCVTTRAQNGFFQNLVAVNTFFISSYISTVSAQTQIVEEGLFSSISSGIADITQLYSADLQNVSSLNNQDINNFSFQTLTVNNYISTPELFVSSINGSEFTSTGITVQIAGVSSLTANFVSSLGAELRQALVSTIQFNAGGFNPKLDLNFDVGSLVGGLKSGLTNIGIGIGAGIGLIATGILGAAFSRPGTTTINNNVYEQYAVPTQLQFSTLGEATSSFVRLVSSSGLANTVPGVEIIISTIIPAGTLCLRSYGDPTNLIDPSTYTSSIQAFGQWEPVPIDISTMTSTFSELYTSTFNTSTINGLPISQFLNENPALWANYPAVSTISFSTGTSAIIQSANTSTDNIALVGSNIQLIGGHTDAKNLLLVSSISTGIIYGANNDIFAGLPFSTPGLSLNAPTIFLSSPSNLIAGVTSVSTLNANTINSKAENISSLTVSSINGFEFPQPVVSTFETASISSATISTINNRPVQTITSAYTSSVLWPNLSTTVNVIASTSITTYMSSYIIAQANTTILNTTNQYHDSFFYLTIDGTTSPSTVTTAVNKVNSHLGQTISYRAYLGPGTWPITANAYTDANNDLQVTQIDLWATGGMF